MLACHFIAVEVKQLILACLQQLIIATAYASSFPFRSFIAAFMKATFIFRHSKASSTSFAFVTLVKPSASRTFDFAAGHTFAEQIKVSKLATKLATHYSSS